VSFIKQVGISFSKVSAIAPDDVQEEDQILSVPADARIFELPTGGFIVIPADRISLYSEEQVNGIVADVDNMLCGDDCK
jgi:hypothetical protein